MIDPNTPNQIAAEYEVRLEQLQARIERLNYSLAQETALSDRLKTASRMPGTGNYVEWIEVIRNSHDQVEQLSARVAELEAENARLNSSPTIEACRQMIRDKAVIEASTLHEQLAAAQAEIKRLRDAIRGLSFGEDWNNGTHANIYRPQLLKLLAQPSDTSALDSFVAEKVREATEEFRNAWNNGEWPVTFANEQIATLTKQRDLAAEALEKVGELMLCGKKAHLPGRCETASKLVIKTLSTIKESGAAD